MTVRGGPATLRVPLFLLCVLAAGASAAAGLAQEQDESAGMPFARAAEESLRAGKAAEALIQAQQAIEADESLSAGWYVAGIALAQLDRMPEARDHFVRATELNPAWGDAQRYASMASFDVGDTVAAWEHAIKAHQAGVDMSEAFAGLRARSAQPDDFEQQMDAIRVVVGGFDTAKFDRDGTSSGARSILVQASADLFSYQQEARRRLSDSASFGLVQRQDAAQYILITEVEFLSNSLTGSRRRLRGVLKLVDARSGEEAYRRRIDFADINSLSYLNREWSRIIALMEEWAAERIG